MGSQAICPPDATAPELRLLADLETDPKAFMDDATTRLELAASHANLLWGIKDDLPTLLTRTSMALDTIRLSLAAREQREAEFVPQSVESLEV